MSEAKKNPKTNGIIVKNIYKEEAGNIKIKDILLKSYILYIRKEDA